MSQIRGDELENERQSFFGQANVMEYNDVRVLQAYRWINGWINRWKGGWMD